MTLVQYFKLFESHPDSSLEVFDKVRIIITVKSSTCDGGGLSNRAFSIRKVVLFELHFDLIHERYFGITYTNFIITRSLMLY